MCNFSYSFFLSFKYVFITKAQHANYIAVKEKCRNNKISTSCFFLVFLANNLNYVFMYVCRLKEKQKFGVKCIQCILRSLVFLLFLIIFSMF